MSSSEDEGSYTLIQNTSTCLTLPRRPASARPDLTTFARLDGLSLAVVGQRLEPDRAVLACRVVEPSSGAIAVAQGASCAALWSAVWLINQTGWRPTTLEVIVRRYRCTHVWRQDTSLAAEPRAKLSRGGLRWALEGIVVSAPDRGPRRRGRGVAWDAVNNAVLAEGS